jgi:hypothetical protein
MANGSSTMTSGVAAGRPQPQTTVESAGGPFIRHSQSGRRAMYTQTGVAFGGLVANPLVAAPGYTRGYRLKIQATGGSGATVNASADAPGDICSLVQLKDSFGTPLIVAPGYEALQLLQLYGGQFGIGNTADITNLPTYSAVSATTGNFTVATDLPLEFAKAYGVISSANASLLPTLQFNVNSTANFYGTTAPATSTPTMSFFVEQDFYWLPEGVSVEPPGIGTTQQWIYQPANPTIGSAATVAVQLPRLGGYLSVVIAELRDSTSARLDAFPAAGNRLRFLIDGVPILDTDITTLYDDIAIKTQVGAGVNVSGTKVITRPSGTIAISRKESLSQESMGLFDTGETFLSTNPGTQLEFAAAPWGAISANAPCTLNALCGQVVPSGALIQGLPEV